MFSDSVSDLSVTGHSNFLIGMVFIVDFLICRNNLAHRIENCEFNT